MNEVGKNIRKFRIQMNMTQEELAQKIISSRTTVSNYETGRSSPDIDMLITISEVFDTSPDGLIFGNKKTEKKMNIKPMYYLLAVSICWIMILYRVSSGVFESGFGLYWYHVYHYFAKPILMAFTGYLLVIILQKSGKLNVYISHKRFIYRIMSVLFLLFMIGSLAAWIGFTKYYGGIAPPALNGMVWNDGLHKLFMLYSRLYEFSLTPLLFLAAGSLTAVMKPLNEKQLTVKNSE